jgi:ABC-2 type transport system ATP-binding protein
MTADLAIDVRGLCKSFDGRTVVHDLTLQVARGQIYGFLGPNGSGKTTSIRMLCGLLKPDAGSGTCLGFDVIQETDAIKKQVGYMTQKFGLYEDLTIQENLQFVARVFGLDNRTRRVADAIERLGLGQRRHQLAGALSGGWKQRLALAACMLHEPKLLLLDEPTAGVDPKARRDFWDQIHVMAAQGITILVSTHYMDEAERCHEIVYIAYGRLLTAGPIGQVIAEAGLTTWAVSSSAGNSAGIAELSRELAGKPGIDAVAAFGAGLHVGGRDASALEQAIAPYRDNAALTWLRTQPNLEDVFIDLVARAEAAADMRNHKAA